MRNRRTQYFFARCHENKTERLLFLCMGARENIRVSLRVYRLCRPIRRRNEQTLVKKVDCLHGYRSNFCAIASTLISFEFECLRVCKSHSFRISSIGGSRLFFLSILCLWHAQFSILWHSQVCQNQVISSGSCANLNMFTSSQLTDLNNLTVSHFTRLEFSHFNFWLRRIFETEIKWL